MHVLMNARCDRCDGHIGIITFYDNINKITLVDHGRCVDCLCNIPLPSEPWQIFKKYCVNIESIN